MKKLKRFLPSTLAFIVAIVVFFGLILIQKKMVNPNGTERVYLVNQDEIDEHTILDEENIKTYFKIEDVDVSNIPDGAVKEGDEERIYGTLIKEKMYKNETLTTNKTVDKEGIVALKEIQNPREISIKGADIAEVVGGILKSGDIIDIDIVDKKSGEVIKVKNQVYVDSVSTTDGKPVSSDNTAVTINIIIDESEQELVKEKLSKGDLKVSKVINAY